MAVAVDLSRLNSLSRYGSVSHRKPQEEHIAIDGISIPITVEKHTEAHREPTVVPNIKLQREADKARAERDEAKRVYAKYQSAIKATEQIRCEIMKEVNAGSTEYKALFIKACNAVSLATGDHIFYEHIQRETR